MSDGPGAAGAGGDFINIKTLGPWRVRLRRRTGFVFCSDRCHDSRSGVTLELAPAGSSGGWPVKATNEWHGGCLTRQWCRVDNVNTIRFLTSWGGGGGGGGGGGTYLHWDCHSRWGIREKKTVTPWMILSHVKSFHAGFLSQFIKSKSKVE